MESRGAMEGLVIGALLFFAFVKTTQYLFGWFPA